MLYCLGSTVHGSGVRPFLYSRDPAGQWCIYRASIFSDDLIWCSTPEPVLLVSTFYLSMQDLIYAESKEHPWLEAYI